MPGEDSLLELPRPRSVPLDRVVDRVVDRIVDRVVDAVVDGVAHLQSDVDTSVLLGVLTLPHT
jgi:hypothetical protein